MAEILGLGHAAGVLYNGLMSTLMLATTLYLPPPRPSAAPRPRLIARLGDGLHGRVALICAPGTS